MEYHEAAAWFELARRWVKLDYLCSKPPAPLHARKKAYDAFLELVQTLSVPVRKAIIPSPLTNPIQFENIAKENFTEAVVTPTLIARGRIPATILEIGSLYTSLAISRGGSSAVEKGFSSLTERLEKLGVERKACKNYLAELRKFQMQKKKEVNAEYVLAKKLADLIGSTVSKARGLQIGNVVLQNSILLPSKDQITLPKRLVGYKSDLEGFVRKHAYERNVFLMMPFRDATKRLRSSIRAVCTKYKLYLVIADETRIVNDLNSNVLACLLGSKYGIAVFSRPESQQTINPNVAYELGLMHRDDKVCLILRDRRLKALPTDLIGYLYKEYSSADAQSIVSHVELWIQDQVI